MKNQTCRLLVTLSVLIAGLFIPTHAEPSLDPYANETKEERDDRMGWWREARFGMFIHWGVYAVPAGVHNGKKWGGVGEWIMLTERISVKDYRAYAQEFIPTKYDPTAWAKLAKAAGMRYLVITSKHHDGFALFPSAVTDWDIADSSPYGEDLIGPLAEATRAEGLKFGLYYSQAQDWVHPGGVKARDHGFAEGEGWDEDHFGDMDQYLKEVAVPQADEIITRYQPDILWWDTAMWMTNERAELFLPLLSKKPGIIHNNRLGGDYKGDTNTPERHIPATGYKDRDWEVCMTMNETWGYKIHDNDWKSTETLIQMLCDIVSKGGNFLLNVGPTAEGEIPQESIERLLAVGEWMDVNGESIYGTTASPISGLTWGRITKKVNEGGATLYLHIFDWPDDGILYVPGLMNMPSSIELLDGATSLNAVQHDGGIGGLDIRLPKMASDPYASVIKLTIKGELDIQALVPMQADDGKVGLPVSFAEIHNKAGTELQIQKGKNGKSNIGYWSDNRTWVAWTFTVDRPGVFDISAEIASNSNSVLTIGLKDQPKRTVDVELTDSWHSYEQRDLGTVTISEAGKHQIEFCPPQKGWHAINIREVTLTPRKKKAAAPFQKHP